jgi:DNA-binding transcriptional regulator YhcF (GntR family)
MNFDNSTPIYVQIGDYICNNILRGSWQESEKIPSVRDLSVSIEVNPNTVLRTYNSLQEKGIIYNKRGIGYFVDEHAYKKVKEMKTREFVKHDLPYIFNMMDLLGLSFDDLKSFYDEYTKHKKQGAIHENNR